MRTAGADRVPPSNVHRTELFSKLVPCLITLGQLITGVSTADGTSRSHGAESKTARGVAPCLISPRRRFICSQPLTMDRFPLTHLSPAYCGASRVLLSTYQLAGRLQPLLSSQAQAALVVRPRYSILDMSVAAWSYLSPYLSHAVKSLAMNLDHLSRRQSCPAASTDGLHVLCLLSMGQANQYRHEVLEVQPELLRVCIVRLGMVGAPMSMSSHSAAAPVQSFALRVRAS